MMSTSSNPVRQTASVTDFPYPELGAGTVATAWEAQAEAERREVAVREAGRVEGEARSRAAFEHQLQEIRASVAKAIDDFARERHDYFRTVEREVVQLAFSIARKILRREAQIDPLLLAGMVRVALEQTAQASGVTVRVHPHQVSDFRVYFARHLQSNPPEVVEDASLTADCCVLHTSLGSTEIGPEVQLKEIEQGLLDLRSAQPHPL